MTRDAIVWAGWSFQPLHPHDARFFREPGLYAFVHRCPEHGRLMLFADHAENLAAEAGPANRMWVEALRLGFNELHVRFPVPRRVDRLELLAHVVHRVQPVLNVVEEAHPPADLEPWEKRRA